MSRDTSVTPGRTLLVLFWMVSSYATAVCTVLFICILDIPIAWLAIEFGFSTGAFLMLSVIPVAAAIFMVQRQRVGERVASAIFGAVVKRPRDFGQVQRVREADALWNDMQLIARKVATEHSEVDGFVKTGERA